MEIEKQSFENVHEYTMWNESFSRVIASARLKQGGSEVVLETINVEHGYRGNGVGTRLLQRIIEDFAQHRLSAWVFEGRTAWYERNGFRRSGEMKGNLVKVVVA